VICDFSNVSITKIQPDHVHVSPARGYPAPDTYKTCATYADGFRTGMMLTHYGVDAAKKARAYAEAALTRARNTLRQLNMSDFTETSIEVIGSDSQYGKQYASNAPREVVTKIAAKHPSMFEGGVLLKELAGLGLASAPGLSGFQGARPKPSPIVRLFSYLTQKSDVSIKIDVDGTITEFKDIPGKKFSPNTIDRVQDPDKPNSQEEMTQVPLIKLAWGRSGDKGNKANIGIIARNTDYLPWIWADLSENTVTQIFAHFIEGGAQTKKVTRYLLPGSNAINFLIDDVLGGGGIASIRNDAQGKGYAQILLAHPIALPHSLAEKIAS